MISLILVIFSFLVVCAIIFITKDIVSALAIIAIIAYFMTISNSIVNVHHHIKSDRKKGGGLFNTLLFADSDSDDDVVPADTSDNDDAYITNTTPGAHGDTHNAKHVDAHDAKHAATHNATHDATHNATHGGHAAGPPVPAPPVVGGRVIPVENEATILYGDKFAKYDAYKTSYMNYPKPTLVIDRSCTEVDRGVDYTNVLMAQARFRHVRGIDGSIIKDADFYKYYFGDELQKEQDKEWWGNDEY